MTPLSRSTSFREARSLRLAAFVLAPVSGNSALREGVRADFPDLFDLNILHGYGRRFTLEDRLLVVTSCAA